MAVVSRLLGPVFGVMVPLVVFWLELNRDVTFGGFGGLLVFLSAGVVVGLISRSWWSLGYPILLGITFTVWAMTGPEEGPRRTPLAIGLFLVFLMGVIPAVLGTAFGTLVGQSLRWRSGNPEEVSRR